MNLTELAEHLEELTDTRRSLSVVAGFDAFVDDVMQVVDCRTSPEEYQPMRTIPDFAQWAAAAAGHSGSREAILLERTPGGCTVNFGDGLMALGFPLHAFAGMGSPPDPAFENFTSRCSSLFSVGLEPGRASVYEFHDGKLMLCSFSHFAAFTPELLQHGEVARALKEKISHASALVLTSWSVYPHMTECWEFLQKEALLGLPRRPAIFLDLADPASRDRGDMRRMLSVAAGFEKSGSTILSLNGNEANRLAEVCGLSAADHTPGEVRRLVGELREHIGISEVGIHLVDGAAAATREGTFHALGPHCPHPKKSVGAGDRFNSGWLAAHLLELGADDALLFASAVSGFFVRNARSASWSEIIQFLRDWQAGTLDQPLTKL